MRALDQTRDGMKIDQLNDSERSPNIFSLFFYFNMGSVMDINNFYQYTKTFNLINTTIKNTTINMGRIWRHPVLSQSEVVYTVAILEAQGDTSFSLCRECSRARRRALAFRKCALGRAASAHVVERTSVELGLFDPVSE